MALSFVQKQTKDFTSVSSTTVVFGAGVTAGSIILVEVAINTGTSSVTVTNTAGDTATDSGLGLTYDNNSAQACIQAFFAPTAGVTTITLTFTGSSTGHAAIHEFAGFTAGTASFDKTAFANALSVSCSSGNTATLTQAAEVAVGVATDYSTFTGTTGGFTSDGASSLPFGSITGYQILSSTSPVAFSATETGVVFAMALVATVKGTVGGGVVDHPLTASGGSYTFSGTAAGVKVARKVAAAAGSYVFTGTAAGLKHGYKVPAGAGSYLFSGAAVTLRHAWVIPAGVGSYTFTGTATGLKHGWVLPAAAGSYSFSGAVASLIHGHPIAAGAGSYTFTGIDATLVKAGQKILAADVGSYSFTGISAGLVHGWKVAAGAGSYSLTGAAASLEHGWKLGAASGSYALSGQAASLRAAHVLPAGSGSYLFSGAAASLRYSGAPIIVTVRRSRLFMSNIGRLMN